MESTEALLAAFDEQARMESPSAPILRRLGFQPIAATTPYVWTPPS